MLESIQTFVQTHTSDLTDGQYLGFGLLLLGVIVLLVWVIHRIFTNWLIDHRLQKHLRSMGHGGLHRENHR